MKQTSLNILLVSTFLFWASGAARLSHELLEHGEESACRLAAPHDRAVISSDKARDRHSHACCATCQTLAGMTAERAPGLDVVNLHVPTPESARLAHVISGAACIAGIPPARGPPACALPA